MLDPTVRRANRGDADDVSQLELLEAEARTALVDQRGGQRWLVEHPEIGGAWKISMRRIELSSMFRKRIAGVAASSPMPINIGVAR